MTTKAEREANGTFWAYRRGERMHVRVGGNRGDGTRVELLGTAAYLHGPRGCCTCCPRATEPPPVPRRAREGHQPPPAPRGPVADPVAAARSLVHPNVEALGPHPNRHGADQGRVRAAMHRFRPGQPLGWADA